MNKLIDANNPKSKEEKQIVAVIESSIDKLLSKESIATLKEIVDKQIFIDATPNNTTINPYEAIETVLNYIDNSISKKVVEKKIEYIKEEGYWEFLTDRDSDKCEEILQELLEGK